MTLALTDVPADADRLDILMVAWICTAANARNERIPFPDGFSQERDRQLEQLAHMRSTVEAAEPDLEAERVWLEGGTAEEITEALVRHFRSLGLLAADDADEGADDDERK